MSVRRASGFCVKMYDIHHREKRENGRDRDAELAMANVEENQTESR
jgi:hypothetical protein